MGTRLATTHFMLEYGLADPINIAINAGQNFLSACMYFIMLLMAGGDSPTSV